MKKTIILITSLIFLTTLCQALEFRPNWWYDFDGDVGGSAVQLSIYIPANGNILKGNYYYKKYETKIELVGQLNDNKIELTEFIDGKPNGYFSGAVGESDRYEGIWTDSSRSKQFDFKMKLASAVYSPLSSNRYRDFGGRNEDVESFMERVKRSILNGDKQWIADHVEYPITTKLNGQKEITIQNRQELIKNFNQIFHSQFKERIKKHPTINLFFNNRGLMLGDGEIWIYDMETYRTGEPSVEKFDYKIIGINNRRR